MSGNKHKEVRDMAEKQEKQDKPEKKLEAPPKTIDPKLSQKVDFTEKPRKKIIINIKKEDL